LHELEFSELIFVELCELLIGFSLVLRISYTAQSFEIFFLSFFSFSDSKIKAIVFFHSYFFFFSTSLLELMCDVKRNNKNAFDFENKNKKFSISKHSNKRWIQMNLMAIALVFCQIISQISSITSQNSVFRKIFRFMWFLRIVNMV
jgi:hypothetical protein